MSGLYCDINVVDIPFTYGSQPDSVGPSEHVAPCSRQMSGGDSIGLGGLVASSLDAFQNFSIF